MRCESEGFLFVLGFQDRKIQGAGARALESAMDTTGASLPAPGFGQKCRVWVDVVSGC